ncbi:MAG: hypothetical protein AAB900_02820 [Patescibacteria group bacterium]
MINLLPLEKIVSNVRDYHSRRFLASNLLFLVILIVSLVMMSAFYWSASLRYRTNLKLTDRVIPGEVDQIYQKTHQETKQLIKVLDQSNLEISSVTAVLEPILNAKIPGIKINGVHFSQVKAGAKLQTSLSVVASTRKSAADFVAVLRQLPGVAEVTHPILIDSRDINLRLEIVWQVKAKSKTA